MKKNIGKSMILAMLLCIAIVSLALPVSATATTSVYIIKYDIDGLVLDEESVTYQWMEANLPVYGDNLTDRYHQGPTFDPDNLWDPDETINLKNKGPMVGTNVKDLCDLVGGMDESDTVKIEANDGFFKWFPWDDIYNYTAQPAQGPMVLCWRNINNGGDVPGYGDGMRIMFFADDHVFGNWDMHERMNESYWHYYYQGGVFYPSTNGYTIKYVSNISIYTAEGKPDLVVTAIDTPAGIYNSTSNIISATIENIGNRSTVEPFSVTLDDGSGVVDTTLVDIGGLGAGEDTTVQFLWTPPNPAGYTLTVTTDSDGVVNEWDETNNTMTRGVTAIPIPQTDLVVTTVHDGDVFVNEPNVIFALIQNNGADASGFSVSLEVDSVVEDKVFIPMLYLRESQLVALDWTPTTTGQKTVHVTVDCDCDVTESNEANNVTNQLVDVTGITTENVGDGESIQAVINAASNGTKILVSGTHDEQITIPDTLSSIRLIANGTAVIHNDNPGDIIKIEATDCWVKGITIHSTWNKDDHADDDDFANYPGAGINITSNSWNVIEENYIYNSSSGVNLYSSNNLFKCNTIGDTEAGRDCRRLMIISGNNNNIMKNLFDGNTRRYSWALGGVLDYTARPKYIVASAPANCNLLRDNTFNVRGASYPSLTFRGDQNLIFNNDINDTTTDDVVPGKLNWYYADKIAVENQTCGNVVHGPFYDGNYWTAYTGSDTDGDLLGDTSYRYDEHPLIRAKCGDANCDEDIGMIDALAVRNHFFYGFSLGNPWAGDVNCDGDTGMIDALAVRNHFFYGFPLDNCCGDC